MQTFITRMAMVILHFSPLTRILCPAHWQILLRFTRMETDQRRYLSCQNISSIDASSSTRFADFHCDATVRRKIVNMRLRMVCGRFYNSFVVRGWLGLELSAWVAIWLRWRMTTDFNWIVLFDPIFKTFCEHFSNSGKLRRDLSSNFFFFFSVSREIFLLKRM